MTPHTAATTLFFFFSPFSSLSFHSSPLFPSSILVEGRPCSQLAFAIAGHWPCSLSSPTLLHSHRSRHLHVTTPPHPSQLSHHLCISMKPPWTSHCSPSHSSMTPQPLPIACMVTTPPEWHQKCQPSRGPPAMPLSIPPPQLRLTMVSSAGKNHEFWPSRFHNLHLVPLIGCCDHPQARILIYERCPRKLPWSFL